MPDGTELWNTRRQELPERPENSSDDFGVLKDECGVCGIYRPENLECDSTASSMAYFALVSLQHRGQESAGIVASDGERLKLKKEMGLVGDVFKKSDFEELKGRIAIAGIEVSRLESRGPTKPQSSPYGQPQIRPHNNTGMCMGENRMPPFGMPWSVIGSAMQSAMHTAVIMDLLSAFNSFM